MANIVVTSNYFQLSLLLLLSGLTHFQRICAKHTYTTRTPTSVLRVSYLHKCSELTL